MVSSQEGVVNTKEITIAITNPVPQELPLNTKEIDNQGHMAKGRRTKRQRPLSPLALTMSTSSESGFRGGSSSGLSPTSESTTTAEYKTNYGPSPVSLTSTASTEEEEDMANCLILLAQGQTQTQIKNPSLSPPLPSATTNSPGKLIAATGDAAYECKTCNRRFHSFQALGGHRASHKKPKFNYPDDKIKPQFTILNEFDQFNQEGISLSLQISNKTSPITSSTRPKVHECTICGAEFSSGQALGGHMRRHRPIGGSTGAGEGRKTAALLALDLNLPAPEDEREEEFVFSSKEKRLIFSSSSLVDCHY